METENWQLLLAASDMFCITADICGKPFFDKSDFNYLTIYGFYTLGPTW